MADEEKEGGGNVLGRVDMLFKRVADYVAGRISVFVAFLFFVFAAGAVYGAFATMRVLSPWSEMVVVAPAVLGLIAYYNRTFATVIFVAVVLVFIVL